MSARKTLSKKLRFEVFKRDSFRCQYCGASAPDVLLHVDHIEPITGGGKQGDITNLITACEPCNLGKGARVLSDQSVAVKRKAQLDQLQERREQLTMMAEWQRGLVDLTETAVQESAGLWRAVCGYGISESGLAVLREHVIKFGAAEVMSAIQVSTKYLVKAGGRFTKPSAEMAFSIIPGICVRARRIREDPELDDLYRLQSLLQHRAPTLRSRDIMAAFSQLRREGFPVAQIRARMERVQKWWEFHDAVKEMMGAGE